MELPSLLSILTFSEYHLKILSIRLVKPSACGSMLSKHILLYMSIFQFQLNDSFVENISKH